MISNFEEAGKKESIPRRLTVVMAGLRGRDRQPGVAVDSWMDKDAVN